MIAMPLEADSAYLIKTSQVAPVATHSKVLGTNLTSVQLKRTIAVIVCKEIQLQTFKCANLCARATNLSVQHLWRIPSSILLTWRNSLQNIISGRKMKFPHLLLETGSAKWWFNLALILLPQLQRGHISK